MTDADSLGNVQDGDEVLIQLSIIKIAIKFELYSDHKNLQNPALGELSGIVQSVVFDEEQTEVQEQPSI